MSEEKAHSLVGASSAYRWLNCLGSNNLILKLKSEGFTWKKATEYTAEGTVAHALAESMFLGAPFNIGAIIKQDGYDIEVTEDMWDAVTIYVDAVQTRLKKEKVPNSYLKIEQRFHLSHIHPDAFGTNDALIEVPFRKLIVFDYKHGAGVPVEVKANPQEMYYAIGAIHELDMDIDEIELVIVQPRAFHRDGPIRSYKLPMAELLQFGEDLKQSIAKTIEPDAPLKMGDWCKFCPAKAKCPEFTKKAISLLPGKKRTITEFSVIEDFPKAEEVPMPTLSEALSFAKLFNEWVSALQEFAFISASNGDKIPGFKLVKKKSNRRWEDLEDAVTQLTEIFGEDEAFIQKEPILLSPAQAETKLKKMKIKTDLPKVKYPDTGNTLVSENDPRKEVNPGEVDEFFVLENEKLNINDL